MTLPHKHLWAALATVVLLLASCTEEECIQPLFPDAPARAVPAVFSVSETRQVRFSPGNLEYAEGHWRFAPSQSSHFAAFSPTAWDHFGWSTPFTRWGMDTSMREEDYAGTFVDWGINGELHVALGSGWRTLTADEWDYLLNRREVNGRRGAGYAYNAVEIDGQYGLIVYPDNYSLQSDTVGTIPDSCVFLPGAGSRMGSNLYYQNEKWGFYWTATSMGDGQAQRLFFHESYGRTVLNLVGITRTAGLSVRLVRDI